MKDKKNKKVVFRVELSEDADRKKNVRLEQWRR